MEIGSLVLIGTRGITMPGDWWLATILWTDGDEVLVRQGGIGGMNPHNQLHAVSSIRCVGDYASLREFQERARVETKALDAAVSDAEQAIGCARAAVLDRLKEIGADVPSLEAPEARAARRRRQKLARP